MIDTTLTELAVAIRARKVSPTGVVQAYPARIGAFITVDAERALATARALESDAAAGRWRGPLHGVPLAYKDLCAVSGLPSSGGSKSRDYFQSPHPCTAVDGGRGAFGPLPVTVKCEMTAARRTTSGEGRLP